MRHRHDCNVFNSQSKNAIYLKLETAVAFFSLVIHFFSQEQGTLIWEDTAVLCFPLHGELGVKNIWSSNYLKYWTRTVKIVATKLPQVLPGGKTNPDSVLTKVNTSPTLMGHSVCLILLCSHCSPSSRPTPWSRRNKIRGEMRLVKGIARLPNKLYSTINRLQCLAPPLRSDYLECLIPLLTI